MLAVPWVENVIRNTVRINSSEGVRSGAEAGHIGEPSFMTHDKCYFFQGEDGRIIFTFPTMDGSPLSDTDADHEDVSRKSQSARLKSQDYLVRFAVEYPEKKRSPRMTSSGPTPAAPAL